MLSTEDGMSSFCTECAIGHILTSHPEADKCLMCDAGIDHSKGQLFVVAVINAKAVFVEAFASIGCLMKRAQEQHDAPEPTVH